MSGADGLALVSAPCHLGLRPPAPGREPGVWRMPAVLLEAGLAARLAPRVRLDLPVPAYDFAPQPGTAYRNGQGLRAFSALLADALGPVLDAGNFPLVLGGDCSVLVGCLAAVRRRGIPGLVHLDGHSDFRHPGNFDFSADLANAAGADLAIATGRGEDLLTRWDGHFPLVRDEHVVQVGERESRDPDFAWPDIAATAMRRYDIFSLRERGLSAIEAELAQHLRAAGRPFWLHLDLDILDAAVLPCVDSPGSPGLAYGELASLLDNLLRTGLCLGADVTIFDPDLDPSGIHARAVADLLSSAFA